MTPSEVNTVRRLCLAGLTNCEIAAIMNYHQSTVSDCRDSIGIAQCRVGRPCNLYRVTRRGGELEFVGTTVECEKFTGMTKKGFFLAAKRGHSKMYTIERV